MRSVRHMKALVSILLFTLGLVQCAAADPTLLRKPLEELYAFCEPVLPKKLTPELRGRKLEAKLNLDATKRSFGLLDAFRLAAGYHARRGMYEKAEGYRKQAVDQLKDFRSKLAAFEKRRRQMTSWLDN